MLNLSCQACETPIPHGTPYVTLNYHVEVTEDGFCIDVLDAVMCAVWCLACAPPSGAFAGALRLGPERAGGRSSAARAADPVGEGTGRTPRARGR